MSLPRSARACVAAAIIASGGSAIAVTASASGHAPAAHAAKCSKKAKKKSPRLLSPCNHASFAAGSPMPTFTAKDRNKLAHKYPPFLDLTSQPPHHGKLTPDTTGKGIFVEMKAVPGHKRLYSVTPQSFNFPGYWLVTPGTYYVQVQQVDCTKKGCHRDSPVETITVH